MNVKVWMIVGRGGKRFHSEEGKSKSELRSDKYGGEQRIRTNMIDIVSVAFEFVWEADRRVLT